MNAQHQWSRHLLISLATLILTLPFLGSAHLFDWDEINFAEAAREMLVSGNWAQVQINFMPFWEKPPFFFWLQAISMKFFGVNEFAARFPNALGAVLWSNLLFYIGSRHYSSRMGWWWVLFYFGSFTPFFYFKSAIIDPWFNLFIFSSLYVLFRTIRTSVNKNFYFFLSGLLLGLAIITKGPVALIVIGLTSAIYWMMNGMRKLASLINILIFFLGILLIPALWFLPETLQNGPWFLITFLTYQVDLLLNPVASHGQPWFYHPIVLLIGCFPAAIFAISKFRQERGMTSEQLDLKRLLVIMFWVVLVLFSAVTTKIVHYSSLCYIPLTFLAALNMYDLEKSHIRQKWYTIQSFLLGLVAFIWSLILVITGLIGSSPAIKSSLLPYIKDNFAKANLLVDGSWNGWEFIIGILFFLGWIIYLIFSFKNRISARATQNLLIFQIIMIFSIMTIFVPRIEKHTQGAAIEFYEKVSDNDAIILTYKFKSYAHYYYGKAKPVRWSIEEDALQNQILRDMKASSIRDLSLREIETYDEKWKYMLMHHNSPRKVYVVCQERKAFEIDENPLFKRLYSKGGFVFYEKITL